MDKAQAARELGVSEGSVVKLIRIGKLQANGRGKPEREAVLALAQQRRIVLDRHVEGVPVFACPTSKPELGGRLELRVQTDLAQEARAALAADGRSSLLTPGRYLTGIWEITEENAERLVAHQGVLIGIAGLYAFDIARVIALAHVHSYRKRKSFIVEPVDDSTRARLLGFVPTMNQTPHEIPGA